LGFEISTSFHLALMAYTPKRTGKFQRAIEIIKKNAGAAAFVPSAVRGLMLFSHQRILVDLAITFYKMLKTSISNAP